MSNPSPIHPPPVLQYTAAPPGSTIVFDVREDGITLVDRPRRWLGRHGSSILAAMFIVLALTVVNLALLVRDRQWGAALVLAVLWVVIVPLMVDRVWKGRLPGIVEVVAGTLVQIRPDLRGQPVRRAWPAERVLRILVVPQLWNWRLELVGELQILIRLPDQRPLSLPKTIRVLSGYRLDELEWARAELLRELRKSAPSDGCPAAPVGE